MTATATTLKTNNAPGSSKSGRRRQLVRTLHRHLLTVTVTAIGLVTVIVLELVRRA